MADRDITSAVAADVNNQLDDYSVATKTTDGATGTETTYINNDWSQQLGYYHKIPELHSSVNAMATWTIGKGFMADEVTTYILMGITGFGKDTFNSILENQMRVAQIGGDSFAHIITDEDTGILINLKPLDPGSVKIVANQEGIIIRYELINMKNGKIEKTFKPEEIFHLVRNRIADEIHGTSMVYAIEEALLARNEGVTDYRKMLHRNVFPQIIWHLDTEDPTEIAKFKAMQDKAVADRENVYIPKGAVEREIGGVAGNQILNPLPWLDTIGQIIFQSTGVPDIILGSSKNLTEASSKIAYLAFQQTTEENQLQLEEAVLTQLNLMIKLQFPARLENELLSDRPKESEAPVQPQVQPPEIEKEEAMQPNDTTAEMEGKK